MASTFSPLGVELMATGENAGTWGAKTNTNLQLVEQILGGFTQQSIAGGAGTTALSITDNGTGDYTVNFTTSMPDTNYAATFTPQDGTGGGALVGGCTHTKAVGSVKCWAAYVSDTQSKTLYDTADNNLIVMR